MSPAQPRAEHPMNLFMMPVPGTKTTTTSERMFSSAFEGGIETDLFDAFVAAVSWCDALALRGTCKAIYTAVDQRFGSDLCSRVEFWKSPVVVVRRQKADQLVASMTPYSDCWSALSDPLFAPFIVRCIDTSRGNQRLRRYCALGVTNSTVPPCSPRHSRASNLRLRASSFKGGVARNRP
jgi:hypothetical protein